LTVVSDTKTVEICGALKKGVVGFSTLPEEWWLALLFELAFLAGAVEENWVLACSPYC
jgi:hypothetical protein